MVSQRISGKKKQGNRGERLFRNWLDDNDFIYVAIDQEKETFSKQLKGKAKRPDFFLLIPYFGIIAVDVKNLSDSYSGFNLNIVEEIAKAAEFERLFGIHLWFAVMDKDTDDGKNWNFLNSDIAIDKGKALNTDKRKDAYLWIGKEHFTSITDIHDFQKLLTIRPNVTGSWSDMISNFYLT
ncbi:hypothetical protein [Alterisphingorhabdus coralli]|uniref:Uncharacterized protein n=1 Tax=Alterisphingorhabdus coralli TaxID=3071408 RepID=A0AA97I199_9SPHN|nr:hypothetical protein [Parasphingorhabdus sp. SCSIO 66989]WOE76519.1 hypothetical protein RB602_07335 [Parasphingorhabdus sp. SCSIO 66989]